MNSSPNFVDWSREKKAEFAESRMLEMKQKNAKLMQRHAEVEQDRIKAEEHNSAVTKGVLKKEKAANIYEPKTESRSEHAREWDRGKPDKEHWRSPDHHASYKNYRTSHYERSVDRKDHWHSFSRNENTDQYRYERGSEGVRNRKIKGNYNYKQRDNDQYQVSTSSHLHMSPKRSRGIGQRNSDPQRKYQSSYSDEKFKKNDYNRSNSKKKYPYRAHSRSTSVDSDCIITNMQISLRTSSLWENDQTSDDQTKQNRVESWVKSVNKSNNWSEKQFSTGKSPGKAYSKFDRFERSTSHSSSDEGKYDPNFNASLRENKSSGSNRYFSSQGADFHENKFGSRGGTPNKGIPSKIYPSAGKQKIKRSPQFSSGGSGKNENFRKQRRFDSRGFKSYDTKDKYNKSKPFNPTVRNNNSQFASSYDRHEDDTWGNVIKDEYNLDDQGIWAHVDQESTNHSKKQCGNKVEDDEGVWGHIEQKSTDHKKEQYTSKFEEADEIWGHVNQEATYRNRKQNRHVEADEIWGDYQQDMSKLGFKKRIVEEDDDGIWSTVVQDCCNTDNEKACKDVSEECASDEDKSSVDYKKQTVHQDIDDNLCNVGKTSFAHNVEQNVSVHEDKKSNKEVDDQADDGWRNVKQPGSNWKLSDEETDLQNAENQNQECESWNDKQISENNNVMDKNIAENDSSYDKEMKNSKFMEPVELNDDSDNVNVTDCVLVPNSEIINVDEDVECSLQKLIPDDNGTNSADDDESSPKQTVCISDERNVSDGISVSEKNQNYSDDGGWSTVSEGEVRSDDNWNDTEHCKTKDREK